MRRPSIIRLWGEIMKNNNDNGHMHVHELIGSAGIADFVCAAHNHRIAAVTGPPINTRDGHVHAAAFETDSFEGHNHAYRGLTGEAVAVGEGHVHALIGMLSPAEKHRHCFALSSLVDNCAK